MKNDKEIIKNIYLNIINDFTTKSVKHKNKAIQKCHEALSLSAYNASLYVKGLSYYSDSSISQLKKAYLSYCDLVHVCKKDIYPEMEHEKDKLIDLLVQLDYEHIEEFRCDYPAGHRISLEKLAEDKMFRLLLTAISAKRAMKQQLSSNFIMKAGTNNNEFYYMNSGSKIHVRECRFCSGRRIYKATAADIKYMDFEYCRCMKKYVAESAYKQMDSKSIFVPQKDTISVFVDESVRENPFKKYDKKLPAKYSIYSYIACKDGLTSETKMTSENILWTSYGEIDTDSCRVTAVAGIKSALIDIRFKHNFSGNVVMYTDNSGAKDYGIRDIKKSPGGDYLINCFKSVTIIYIPRRENQIADELGRQISMMFMSNETMKKITEELRLSERLKRENLKLQERIDELEMQLEYLEVACSC